MCVGCPANKAFLGVFFLIQAKALPFLYREKLKFAEPYKPSPKVRYTK